MSASVGTKKKYFPMRLSPALIEDLRRAGDVYGLAPSTFAQSLIKQALRDRGLLTEPPQPTARTPKRSKTPAQ